MHWLQELDHGLLRFINQTLSNSFFDALMPFASGNAYFFPLVVLAGILLLWKGGRRGRLCLLMLALILGPGDGLITNTLKHAVARPRPFVTDANVLLPASKMKRHPSAVEDPQAKGIVTTQPALRVGYNSMPSSHAANWWAATMIFLVYFRRSLWVMLPLACLVSFSRVYNGVHYPSDVLAGAILGAGYAAAGMWAFNALWQWLGRKWFPLWWKKLPSLVTPNHPPAESGSEHPDVKTPALAPLARDGMSDLDQHWVRLGYVLIAVLFVVRLLYIAGGVIELSGDEAYQWIWSKHLALSYYSKPPMIAYTQWLGTALWGDTELGVRFFSPVLGALASLLLLRFIARQVSGPAAVVLVLISATTPLLAVGSTLMTVDPLSVFFWVCAMLAGWRAVQPESKTSDWLWTGLWMGLGFLSKYTGLFQLLCWAVFFVLWKPARPQLRRLGPYLALLVNLLCAIPVLIWNAQHHWITGTHLASNAGLGSHSRPRVFEFLTTELGLLNPVYFIAALWAMIAFWRPLRRNVLAIYLFSMGSPLFLCYLIWSFHSRILPNWIAPSILPMFCLMVVYWRHRRPAMAGWSRAFLIAGLALGLIAVTLMHNTDLIKGLAGRPLPPKIDPITRVRSYQASAQLVEAARQKLQGEGKPVFVICANYQTTGLISFYLPEARTNVSGLPLVYAQATEVPKNQFYFWPGYREQRKGQNALYVREVGMPSVVKGWFFKWLHGDTDLSQPVEENRLPPPDLVESFESVKNLGQFDALYRGRVFHIYQFFECRNLR